MSTENAKKIVWSNTLLAELDKQAILSSWCWSKYEGQAKQNATVKLLSLGDPTISDFTGTLAAAESLEDSSIYLTIDQAKSFNFAVDDTDDAKMAIDVMEEGIRKAAKKMALARDSHVAKMALYAPTASTSTQVDTAAKAKAAIDAAILSLRENDVAIDDEVVIEIPYFVYQKLKDNIIELKTNNDELIKKGVVGMYDNCLVRYSNNLYSDGTDFYAMARTHQAISFAGGIDKFEMYRPELKFADAAKGLNTFGAKITKPKELFVMKLHK